MRAHTCHVTLVWFAVTVVCATGGDPEERSDNDCQRRLSEIEKQLEIQGKARAADEEEITTKLNQNFSEVRQKLVDENRELKRKHEEEEKKRGDAERQLEETKKEASDSCDRQLNDWQEKVKVENENCQNSLADKDNFYREEMRKLNVELERVRETHTEGDKDRETKDGQISELMTVIDNLKNQLQSSQDENQRLTTAQDDVEQIRQQIASEKERGDRAESQLKQSEERTRTLEQQVAASGKNSEESKKQVTSLQQELTVEQKKVSSLNGKLHSTTTELNKLKEKDKDFEVEVESLKEQLTTIQEDRDSLEDEAELLKSRAEVQASEIDELKSKLTNSSEDAARLEEERDTLAARQDDASLKFNLAVGVIVILLVHEVFLFCRTGNRICINMEQLRLLNSSLSCGRWQES